MPVLAATTTGDTGTGGKASSATVAHTVGAGTNRYLLVTVSARGAAVSGVTYGGTALVQVIAVAHGNGSHRASIWRMFAPPSGTADVVVTLDANASCIVGVRSFTDCHQTNDNAAAARTATGSDTAPTVNVASATDQLVVDCMTTTAQTTTVGPGQTEQYNYGLSGLLIDNIQGTGSTEPGAATTTMSWSYGTSVAWVMAAVPILPPGGAALTGTALVSAPGTVTASGLRSAVSASVVDGAGQVDALALKSSAGVASVVGGGAVTASGVKESATAVAVTGAGTVVATGSGSAPPAAAGTALVTGVGTVTTTGVKSATGNVATSGAGSISAAGVKRLAEAVGVTGAGSVATGGAKDTSATAATLGAGVVSTATLAARGGTSSVAALGIVTVQSSRFVPDVPGYVTVEVVGAGVSVGVAVAGASEGVESARGDVEVYAADVTVDVVTT